MDDFGKTVFWFGEMSISKPPQLSEDLSIRSLPPAGEGDLIISSLQNPFAIVIESQDPTQNPLRHKELLYASLERGVPVLLLDPRLRLRAQELRFAIESPGTVPIELDDSKAAELERDSPDLKRKVYEFLSRAIDQRRPRRRFQTSLRFEVLRSHYSYHNPDLRIPRNQRLDLGSWLKWSEEVNLYCAERGVPPSLGLEESFAVAPTVLAFFSGALVKNLQDSDRIQVSLALAAFKEACFRRGNPDPLEVVRKLGILATQDFLSTVARLGVSSQEFFEAAPYLSALVTIGQSRTLVPAFPWAGLEKNGS